MFPTFKTQDEVPEAFREMYEEKDGAWVAKAPPAGDGPTQEDVDKLTLTLEKERKDRKDAEKAAKDLESRLAALETKAKAEKAGITDDQLQKLRDEVRADLEKEYAEFKAQAETLSQENRSLKLDSQVKALAGKHGVRAERIDAWWRQFGDRFDLTDDGKPMVKDRPGTPVDKYITGDLKTELPELYSGTQAAGGGAAGIVRDGKPVAGTGAEDVLRNPGEALRAAREAGQAA